MGNLEDIAMIALGSAGLGYVGLDYLRAKHIFSTSNSLVREAIMNQQHHQPISLPLKPSPWTIGALSRQAKRHYESIYYRIREGEKMTFDDLSS